ncbi:MAG: D-tyrosyl-tRNA(Tyr) deacylase [Candidatus Eremiobacteraeota bacterium]|nr:D-aminoacyl-tRNA deacylase [Candidatus Eremiobacteraeota bacterium]NNM92440.1 D-tyrosyl-tRNA(Tyr) deacylase [Candidatus Eremiobacteraeota bacterium]
MRAVLTRVTEASVRVGGETVGAIGAGLLVLLGVARDDDERDARTIAEKILGLRIWNDENGKMNRDIHESGGALLLVSQFTLLGDARSGKRPSFITAAPGEQARNLYEYVGSLLERAALRVAYGRFGETMAVESINDGPVTLLLDSKRLF